MAVDDLLIRVRSDVAAAQRGLQNVAGTTRQLTAATTMLGTGMGRTSGFALDLGRALNDSQQFAYGFRQGLVAVSNQAEGLAAGLRAIAQQARETGQSFSRVLLSSLMGPAGLIAGLNLAVTAAIVFGPAIARAFKQTEDAAGSAADSYRDAFDQFIRFETASRRFTELTTAQARAGYTNARALRDQLVAARDLLQAQREAARPGRIGGPEARFADIQTGDPQEFTRLSTEVARYDQRIQELTGNIGAYAEEIRNAQNLGRVLADVERDIGTAVEEETGATRRATRATRERTAAIRDFNLQVAQFAKPGFVPGGLALFGDSSAITQMERMARVLAILQDDIRGTGEVLVEAQRPFNEFASRMTIAFGGGAESAISIGVKSMADAFAGLISLQDGFADFGKNVVGSIQDMIAAMGRAILQALFLQAVFAGLNAIPGFGASGIGGFLTRTFGLAGGNAAGGLAGLAAHQSGPTQLVGLNLVTPISVVTAATRRDSGIERGSGLRG